MIGQGQFRTAPLFPISTCNVRNRVLIRDLPRLNNSCEGFHWALKSSITYTHPNIWKLSNGLQKELSLSETKILHKDRGDVASKKKMYVLLNERIKKQVEGYRKKVNKLDYLENVSRNLK